MWLTRNTDGHRVWFDDMIGPGERGWVGFCICGQQFWPITSDHDWRNDPVKREPPD